MTQLSSPSAPSLPSTPTYSSMSSVTLNSATVTNLVTPASSGWFTTTTTTTTSNISTGAAVGIAVAVLAILSMVVFVVLIVRRRKRHSKERYTVRHPSHTCYVEPGRCARRYCNHQQSQQQVVVDGATTQASSNEQAQVDWKGGDKEMEKQRRAGEEKTPRSPPPAYCEAVSMDGSIDRRLN